MLISIETAFPLPSKFEVEATAKVGTRCRRNALKAEARELRS